MKKTKIIVFTGLFIALNVVLDRFLSIQTDIVRISLGFLPIALTGYLFGPVAGGLAGALSDIVGMIVFPKGAYFPGFTLTGLIGGAAYGLILNKKPVSILRVTAVVLAVAAVCDLGLNTFWLYIITGKAAFAIFVPRLVKTAIMIPIQVFLVYSVSKLIGAAKLMSTAQINKN